MFVVVSSGLGMKKLILVGTFALLATTAHAQYASQAIAARNGAEFCDARLVRARDCRQR
jgi:hypothetical protein